MKGIPDIGPFKKRLKELDDLMTASDFYSDQRKAAEVSREHQKLMDLIGLYHNLEKLVAEEAENNELINDPNADPELKELAQEEIATLPERIEKAKTDVLLAMIPPDPSDSRNTIIEIRAGAGGDEASLFAGDLCRMYTRFAEIKGWTIEPMSSSASECGGFKEVSFLVKGDEVYKTLKFESGVHRVQRIPVTESGGRIHTSTATVAVLPEAEEVDIHIDPSDLEVSVCRASGPGGQGVNTTDSAVQMLHKPTGIMVFCADERSQIKNRAKALKVLRSRLLKQKEEEERAKYAANRKSQVGSGDRSERIRTYNFPQSRLTDHRIGFSSHDLPSILEGNIDDLVLALQMADQEAKLTSLLEQE
ncbi:MAG: peptide chain release factor 1 [Verrucomicrobia bacterium CG_4_10_14_3_um_filter_43_23]|nr:MAG: peptide chain release factor 1 [Verrucomicrobia bacterium CG1_02_43_26]PIP59864.1 MAG: peptide chain release factor 1 [Verrucomicrobia bacterium CG22_combo_CG10-13_8_21_14_all_43_17]PIX58414.1 MAG: peptide chain release factor 1 [Verrucomicrobia bacterium CG_4_10_14_3_um_filter_43_23]PIY61562.1 MAG: peptide chain release factor 1 [Verrucomicrobia bacterium CG_4_10_14_0_8_um_filter_43_34]PJA43639.1 MAG: peptide chain release factor 1 [Verrucomicrobia bacterium CG_4_9_14_3_um_filter_43_20